MPWAVLYQGIALAMPQLLTDYFQSRAADRRAPFPNRRKQHGSREEGKHQHTWAHSHSVEIMTHSALARQPQWHRSPSSLI